MDALHFGKTKLMDFIRRHLGSRGARKGIVIKRLAVGEFPNPIAGIGLGF